jgi:hypothetical protein
VTPRTALALYGKLDAICGGTWLGGYTARTRRLLVAGLEERASTAASVSGVIVEFGGAGEP